MPRPIRRFRESSAASSMQLARSIASEFIGGMYRLAEIQQTNMEVMNGAFNAERDIAPERFERTGSGLRGKVQ
jgi:hypothetical protein